MLFKTILSIIALGAPALVYGIPTSAEQQAPGEANQYEPPVDILCPFPCSPSNCPPPLFCVNGCCGGIP
ncbi:hypothetical protein TgHK011_001132 [Trichoderma gracile]|nr:hypothetical protein TgHK011_001132 [Trichoderma gracile]